jgi:toxin ParE1/3/4
MSARKSPVVLKPAARRDFRAILVYTSKRWGVAQRDTYRALFDRTLETLGANPEIGRAQDDISLGLRSFVVEQHVIYYRVIAGGVTVVRILHGKMDATRHLDV